MVLPQLTLRIPNGAPLTAAQMDNNLTILANGINSIFALLAVSLNPDGTLLPGAINNPNMFAAGVIPDSAFADPPFASGDIKPTCATAGAPTGWLVCDGTSYSTGGIYANLFAAIGYTWGGSGSSFNVPDFRGRALIGAGSGPGLTARTLGQQAIGEEGHVQKQAELAQHAHTLTPPAGTRYCSDASGGSFSPDGSSANDWQNWSGVVVSTTPATATTAANVMQPSAVVNWLIRL